MRSLRARLLLPLLVGVTACLVAGDVAVYLIASRSLSNELRASLLTQARALGSMVVIDNGLLEIEATIDSGQALPIVYRVLDEHGTIVAEGGKFNLEHEPVFSTRPGAFAYFEAELPGDEDGLLVALAVRPGLEGEHADEEPPPAPVVVLVARSTASLTREITFLGSTLAGTGVLVILTTAILVLLGVRAGLRPLGRFTSSIADITPDSLDPINTPPDTPTELAPAYHAINASLTRLRSAFERERRFTDAAAHELRTPIAELQTALEVARRWPEPERIDRALAQSIGIIDGMTGLIDALLALSRNPADLLEIDDERLPLANLVREEVNRLAATVRTVSLTLRFDITEASSWAVPAHAGRIIVRNLMDNAIEYTPAGGTVIVTLGADELSVENSPVDLDTDQVSHLFEPFWRADPARSRRGHHGLGLAVVAHAAAGCGLVCDASLAGTTLTIRIRASHDAPGPGAPKHA